MFLHLLHFFYFSVLLHTSFLYTLIIIFNFYCKTTELKCTRMFEAQAIQIFVQHSVSFNIWIGN